MNRREVLGCGAALLTAYGSGAHAQAVRGVWGRSAPGGDLAIVNAKIWTMDPARPRASAALVRNGRIALVGSDAEVRGAAGSAQIFNAGGHTVTPGFIDSHTHFELACEFFAGLHVDCHYPSCGSLADMLGLLRTRAAKTPPGRWIMGRSNYGLDELVTEKRYATREEMDAISTSHPIVLASGLHVFMMNTYALQLSGLWTEAEEKAARWKDGRARVGSSVARDANGVPTGVGTEVKDRFIDNMFTREERKAAVRSQIVPHFVSKGLTTLASLPMHLNALSIDQELQLAGELPMRLRSYYRLPDLTTIDAIIDLGLLPGVGNDMMRYGGPKVYVAGNSHDAYGNVGPNMKWTQEELNDVIWRGHSAGQQFLLHQAGGSLPATFEAIGKAQAKDRRDLRHRLEHYSGLRDPAEIRQMKELGMRVSITTPQSGRRNPGGAAPQLPLYNTLIRAGLEPVGISDATGTVPDFGPLNSIASITSPLSEGGSAPAGEAPSIEDAIRMWTIWSATSTFEEGEKGSITPGKLGDFAVLSHDLEKVRGGQMFDVTNTATILGGKLVYNG